jgi:hypothetical protein
MRELEEIQSEHRAIVNLFLSVIILGLLLNCVVSAAFLAGGDWIGQYVGSVLFVVLALTLVFSWFTIKVAIFRPMLEEGEFPTVVVIDVEEKEIPLPLVMSARRERILEGDPPPFPIVARNLYRLVAAEAGEGAGDPESNDPSCGHGVEELVQFAILQWYRQTHWFHWAVGREYRDVGPFVRFGWTPDKPSCQVLVSEFADSWAKANPLIGLRYTGTTKHLTLPQGMSLKVEANGQSGGHWLIFAGKVLDLAIGVTLGGGVGGPENFAGWDRRFRAQPENMFAHQVTIRYEIKVHERLQRYIPGGLWDWGPMRAHKPQVTIRDLYHWARGIVEQLEEYLTWYQSESDYLDSDLMHFDREDEGGHAVYRFREPYMGMDTITF